MARKKSPVERESNPVWRAVTSAGGAARVARSVGVSRQSVMNWVWRGRMIQTREYKRALRLAELSGLSLYSLLVGFDDGSGPTAKV
jgi:hypothetical protein